MSNKNLQSKLSGMEKRFICEPSSEIRENISRRIRSVRRRNIGIICAVSLLVALPSVFLLKQKAAPLDARASVPYMIVMDGKVVNDISVLKTATIIHVEMSRSPVLMERFGHEAENGVMFITTDGN